MKVRCGGCAAPFDVQGPGRHSCPACGAVNAVRSDQELPPESPDVKIIESSEPSASVGRHICPECSFSFYAGDVAVAPCPNCRFEVVLRADDEKDGIDV